MSRPFTTASYLMQHLSALRALEKECPADFARIVAQQRWMRRQARK